MVDQIANIAKGRFVEMYNRVENNDPANSAFIFVLLQAAEADAVLLDYDDLGALLGAAGNTEADFTNYARKTITDVELAPLPAPDDVNNRRDVDMPDQTFANAGGALNNNLVKAVIGFDPDTTGGTDAAIEIVGTYEFAIATNGGDVTAQVDPAGFARAG